MRLHKKLSLLFLIGCTLFLHGSLGAATFSQSGYVQETLYQGNGMISMRFDYAGRLWVIEKQGRILVFTPNADSSFGRPIIFSDLSAKVNTQQERGMIGLALDPDFKRNRHLYILFSTSADQQIIRMTSNQSFTAEAPNSSLTLLKGLPNSIAIHKGGDIDFHPLEPKSLYVMLGDDGKRKKVGNLNTYHGKILKINASDGTGLASNPYYDGNVNSVRSRIWSARYRNPFRFAFDPASSSSDVIYISENGDGTDRIARVEKGADGGWDNQFTKSSSDNKLTILQTSKASKTGIVIFRKGPMAMGGKPTLYNAKHNSEVRRWTLSGKKLNNLTPIPSDRNEVFAHTFGHNIASFTKGSDGALYYTSSGQGSSTGNRSKLARIRFIGGTPPKAGFTQSSQRGSSPLTVKFSDTSTAPSSKITSWNWNFGNGKNSSNKNPSQTYDQPGVYNVTLLVTNAQGLQQTFKSKVTVYHRTTLSLTGKIYDARTLPAKALSKPTQLRFYQKDGVTPLTISGGKGVHKNAIDISAGGKINNKILSHITGDAILISAGEPRSDGIQAAYAGIPVSTSASQQSATATFYLSDTLLRGKVTDTKGKPAPVDIGVSTGSPSNFYALPNGRDYLKKSGIAKSGIPHRIVPDLLGYYHIPILAKTGSTTLHLNTSADNLSKSYGKVVTSVAIKRGTHQVKDLLIGLYHGGSDEIDLSDIPVTPNVSFSRQIQPILSASCAGCHNEIATNSGGLDLQKFASLANLIEIESFQAPGIKLVASGSAATSYLMEKINAKNPQVGTSMRPGDIMPLRDQALIRDWINQLTVPDPNASPEITSSLKLAGTKGNPMTYQITASNLPSGFTALNLPQGLSIDTKSGLVSGIPRVSGQYQSSIIARNKNGQDKATLNFTLTDGPPPKINNISLDNAKLGKPYSYKISATNHPTEYKVTGLPAGVSLNRATGVISGIPTTLGDNKVTIIARNSNGHDTKILTLSVIDILSVNRPIFTSSDINANNSGAKAVDMNLNSRWESKHGKDPQWITVDLGSPKKIRQVTLHWENAGGRDYRIQISDKQNGPWKDMKSIIGNTTVSKPIHYNDLNLKGRYIRIHGTSRTTIYGYSIYNFEVWGLTK